MPVASMTARTQYTHLGLFSQRYGSFAGKGAAVTTLVRTIAMDATHLPTLALDATCLPTVAIDGVAED